VPAGSLALGGAYCGIYPVAGPGGWHLLGRTDAVLFDPASSPPALLQPGDKVRLLRA
jgi:allophanate hydrolase subunit 1